MTIHATPLVTCPKPLSPDEYSRLAQYLQVAQQSLVQLVHDSPGRVNEEMLARLQGYASDCADLRERVLTIGVLLASSAEPPVPAALAALTLA